MTALTPTTIDPKHPSSAAKIEAEPSAPKVDGEEAGDPPLGRDAQTRFAEELPLFPGEGEPTAVVTEEDRQRKRKQQFLFVAVVVSVIFVLLGIVLLLASLQRAPREKAALPTLPPTTTTKVETELDRRLQQLQDDVNKADPLEPKLALPPIDFGLILEDATTVQARKNSRRR